MNGELSDLVNLARAKDAGLSLALGMFPNRSDLSQAAGVNKRADRAPGHLQKSLNRSGESSVYLTVCWMFLCPR